MARTKKQDISIYQTSLFDEEGEVRRPLAGGADFRRRKVGESASELAAPIVDLDTTGTFRFMSFGSGSSGNCSYIGNERGGLLIDAGVDIKKVVEELEKNNIRPESLKGICLTHDHGDHVRYVYAFLRRYKTMGLFCTPRAFNGLLRRHSISRRIKDYHVAIYQETPFKVGDFELTAFAVSHDGTCNSGFSVGYGDARFVLATDLGAVTARARHYMSEADYLVLESNYDRKMLDDGAYPEYLKSRIRSDTGHLDNADAARFLGEIYSPRLKYVFLCHLSHDNNRPELARRAAEEALAAAGATVGEATDSLVDRSKDVQLMVLPRYDATRCFKFRVKLR